jgi:hypothetical protein
MDLHSQLKIGPTSPPCLLLPILSHWQHSLFEGHCLPLVHLQPRFLSVHSPPAQLTHPPWKSGQHFPLRFWSLCTNYTVSHPRKHQSSYSLS